jgi:hypothetical protein
MTTIHRRTTMKRIIPAAALLLASSAALAFHCPADMKKIDAALAKSPKLSAEQLAQVKKHRAEGESLHKAGKHQASVDELAKAMGILKIQYRSAFRPAFHPQGTRTIEPVVFLPSRSRCACAASASL